MSNQPSFNELGSITPDELMAGGPIKSDSGTLLSGQKLTRGTLLGKITVGAASVNTIATKGALTLDETTPLLAGAQVGAYKAVCITAQANAGIFEVFDPQGNSLGLHAVAGAAFANQVKFAIADGGVDFAAGDTFTITVAAGSGKYVKSLKASIDGSQIPTAILAEDCDATSADKVCTFYIAGEVNVNSVVFGTGHTAANTKDGLRNLGIYLITPVAR